MNPAGQLCKASLQIKDAFAALRSAKLALYESSGFASKVDSAF